MNKNLVRMMRRVRIRRAYPLTTPRVQKLEDAAGFDGWTAFVNNAHTLVHVVHGEGGGHWWERLPRETKTWGDDRLLLHLVVLLSRRLVL